MKIRNNIQTGLNTYASYSVAGLVNQNLSGVNTTRLKLTGNTSYNFGTASTSSLYSYIVEAGTYSFNLGTYSNYKVLSSDFPAIGSTGSGLTGSFTLDGLFDGSSMWIKSQLGFFDMPKPSAAPAQDADFLAFKSRVEAAGGSLTGTEETATNQLVVDLKSYSLWSKIKAFYPFVGGSNGSCRQNLKSSSFTGTFSGSMTIDSSGITSDGSSGYMNTGLVPNTTMSYDNQHYLAYIPSGVSSGARTLLGVCDSGYNGVFFYLNVSGLGLTIINEYVVPSSYFTNDNRNGCWSINLISTTKTQYRNGSSVASLSAAPTNLTLGSLYISARNDGNANAPNEFSTNTISCVSIGDGLTAGEHANIYTSIQAFQTTLGRNV